MKRGLILLTTLTLLIVLVAGCNEIPSEPAATSLKVTPQTSTQVNEEFNFRLLISDEVNVIDRFNSVNVTISKIGIQKGGESGSWYEPEDFESVEVNLKELMNENATEIWKGNLAPGSYSKVFIYVDGIISDPDANIKLPSGKLQINKSFEVVEGEVTNFVYDITIIEAGKSGKYILKPQIAQSGANQKFKDVSPKAADQDDEDEIEFKGTINSLEPLTIGDYEVVINDNTEIKGELEEGLTAKVEGILQEDGSVLAEEIKVKEVEARTEVEAEAQVGDEIEFEGTINSLEPLTIGNHEVVTDDDTKIKGELEEGLTAKVEGILQEDGSVLAEEIEVEED